VLFRGGSNHYLISGGGGGIIAHAKKLSPPPKKKKIEQKAVNFNFIFVQKYKFTNSYFYSVNTSSPNFCQ